MLLLSKYLRISKQLIVCLFLFKNILLSQNLIRNASFENYHTPINWNLWGGDFIGYYTWPPDTVMIDWGGYQTPDFLTTACSHTYSGVPINLFGYSNAKDGNGYVGLGIYEKGGYGKEYIYQKLTQPLQSGKVYCLSFYVNRADRFTYAIKNIGALFTTNLQPVTNGYEINATPQVINQGSIISDTINWTQIQGCFTANGGEQYITIGNFTTNFNTDTLNTNSTNLVPGREATSYYYIDDITLIDQSTVGIDELNLSAKINLHPNPNNGTMVLDYDLGADDTGTLQLMDVTGKIISSYKIVANKGILQMNEQNLMNGVYFYRILVKDKIVKTDKVVIIK